MNPAIIWFRKDLRLKHHFAIEAAAKEKKPMIFVYIFDQDEANKWAMGSAQRVWLHKSLKELSEELKDYGSSLILKQGDTVSILKKLVKEHDADQILFHSCYEPGEMKLEKEIHTIFSKDGVEVKRFASYLLFHPEDIKTKQGGSYSVYTPFSKSCLAALKVVRPLGVPKIIPYKHKTASDHLEDWDLIPKKPDWSKGFDEYWTPGEAGAHKKLQNFIKHGFNNYANGRDFPALESTSKLSPHLHFGEITPMQILYELNEKGHSKVNKAKFVSEIFWREFAYHLLYHFPKLPNEPFQEKFADFKWDTNKKGLHAWQKGLTGYPIVDAGMRQLWHTGWMHNRIRMVVASFLIKDLFIHWKEGERWFWDTLVDADLANNAASWQWVAGCGADAAPYFRIFNPVTQSEKFDPDGEYIRTWVPELARLNDKYIHCPWEAPEEILKKARIELGKDYPLPIVSHEEARQEAMQRYNHISKKS